MEVIIGKKGINVTFQEPFKKTIKCAFCGKEAKIMFVAHEFDNPENYICNLYRTMGKKGSLWLHDACSIGCYLCPNCFEVTSELNQA